MTAENCIIEDVAAIIWHHELILFTY